MPAPKNPRRISELGALRIVDPNKWARLVRRAIKDADGYLEPAAEVLDVSERTLQRWLADERLSDVAELVESRRGYRRDR